MLSQLMKNVSIKYRKIIPTGIVVIAVVSSMLFFPVQDIFASESGKEIEITVGYQNAKNYIKKIISVKDLNKEFNGKMHQAVYTWISKDQTCWTTEAEGVYLSELMDYAEIDAEAVDHYDVILEALPEDKESGDDTSDAIIEADDTASWTKKELVEGKDGDRYSLLKAFQLVIKNYNQCEDKNDFINNPDDYYTIEDIFDYQSKTSFKDSAWKLRSAVQPMLSLKMKSVEWKQGSSPPTSLDYSNLQELDAPVIVIGQATKDEVSQKNMTRSIRQINILYEGEPEIMIKGTDLNGDVGSKGSVTVHVSTPDPTLTEMIRSEIILSSSNPSVATVDKDGNVEIIGEGKASIIASYDLNDDGIADVTRTIGASGTKVSGNTNGSESSGSSDTSGSSNTTDNPSGNSGTDQSTDSADRIAAAENDSMGNSRTAGSSNANASFTPRSTTSTNTTPNSSSRTTVSPGTTNRAGTVSAADEETDTGTDIDSINSTDTIISDVAPNGTAYEVMLGDSPDSGGVKKSMILFTFMAGGIALVGGTIVATGNYWMQTEWIKRAKKLFEKQG